MTSATVSQNVWILDRNAPSDSPIAPTCNRHRVPFFTRFSSVFSIHSKSKDSVSSVMLRVASGAGSLRHPSRRSPSLLTMEPLKWPFSWRNHEIMVRDPGNRFTENASLVTFLENTRGPAASDGTNVSSNSQDEFGNSGVIKCFARLSHNTLPWKSPAPGTIPMLFFRPIHASNTFRVSFLSTASIFLAPGKLACLRKLRVS